MAFAMNITVGTVRTYVKNVLAKLGAHSRLQLAALASQDGLLIDQVPASAVLASAGGRWPGLAANRCCKTDRAVTLTEIAPSVPPKIQVLILDQQRTFHDALAVRLRAEPDLMVAAEAQSTSGSPRPGRASRPTSSCSTPSCRTTLPSPSVPR